MTILLLAINIPVIALILAFTILVVDLEVNQRCNEIAVIRSPGDRSGRW